MADRRRLAVQDYDAKYEEGTFRNPEAYFRRAGEMLGLHAGQRLLDIGCALGDMLARGQQAGAVCHGIDLSRVAAARTHERVPTAHVVLGDAEALPYDDASFDAVTMLSALEHLMEPGTALLEIRRVLRPDGRALIVVPNAYYLPDIVWQVWRQGRAPDHKQSVERFATSGQWREYLERGGLQVLSVGAYNFPLPRCRRDMEWYRLNPRRWLGMLAAPLIPFHLSNSFFFLCARALEVEGRPFAPPPWPAPPKLSGVGGRR